jgi:hypothetical protein
MLIVPLPFLGIGVLHKEEGLADGRAMGMRRVSALCRSVTAGP